MSLPNGEKHNLKLDRASLPDVPLLTNPRAIPAKTHLIAIDDLPLRQIMKKEDDAIMAKVRADAEAAAQAAKDAETKASGTSESASKKTASKAKPKAGSKAKV